MLNFPECIQAVAIAPPHVQAGARRLWVSHPLFRLLCPCGSIGFVLPPFPFPLRGNPHRPPLIRSNLCFTPLSVPPWGESPPPTLTIGRTLFEWRELAALPSKPPIASIGRTLFEWRELAALPSKPPIASIGQTLFYWGAIAAPQTPCAR